MNNFTETVGTRDGTLVPLDYSGWAVRSWQINDPAKRRIAAIVSFQICQMDYRYKLVGINQTDGIVTTDTLFLPATLVEMTYTYVPQPNPMLEHDLRKLQALAWNAAEEKGFHAAMTSNVRDATMIRLALIHTEVSEATQEVKRHGVTATNKPKIGEELADAVIRLLDLAGCLDIDLCEAINAKMEVNQERPDNYGTPDEVK